MIIKHETSNLIKQVKSEDSLQFLTESITAIHQFMDLLQVLSDYDLEKTDEDALMAAMEDNGEVADFAIKNYAAVYASVDSSINKYLNKTVAIMSATKNNITLSVSSGCYPSLQEIKLLKDGLERSIGGLSFILFHEFKLYHLLESGNKDGKDIDEIYKTFTETFHTDPVTTAREIRDYANEFRIKLDFFDAYPEKESDFISAMGPLYVGLENADLTLEVVESLLEGTLDPEDLYAMYNSVSEDENGN